MNHYYKFINKTGHMVWCGLLCVPILIFNAQYQLSLEPPIIIDFMIDSLKSGIFYDLLKISLSSLFTLTIRKIIVLGLIGVIFLTANILVIANWISDAGIAETFQGR